MAHGNVLQIGSPKELYNRPVSIEVADFIGQMNFIDGSVVGTEKDQATVDTACLGKVTTANKDGALIKGDRIVVAVRPEKLLISSTKGRTKNAIKGVLKAAAYLGDRSHYFVKVEGLERPIAVAAQNVDRSIEGWLSSGEAVRISWNESSLVLLPPV
jgi:spermidine/putrescine transport system ATP-binding protein/putrescine transport system ATP-binding protein